MLCDSEITKLQGDVIVNSANPGLNGIGPELPDDVGGVDGAIHRAAGRELWAECQKIPQFFGYFNGDYDLIRCAPGDLRVTEAFNLPFEKIFHAVAPAFIDNKSAEMETLASLYERIFSTAVALNFCSIVIPPLGTGSFGLPKKDACDIALSRAAKYVTSHNIFVFFSLINADERTLYENRLNAPTHGGSYSQTLSSQIDA